ncbi:MAG: phosphate acyltransferase PlsX [Lentisphaerae bacterium]|nr:phosphate acyltransferase PlsX [Lentisphaerota bacterium]MBQ9803964.1 phosphate acyltransferase PlsX [Lentisphaeria bacterium]
MRIGVDAMGGDFAPGVVVEGVSQALIDFPHVNIVLAGHRDRVNFYLEKYGIAGHPNLEVVHAPSVCEMSEPSAVSLRAKRDSSITMLAKMLKAKEIDAMATPGHTGATVAATKVLVRTLPGVDRPALGASMPAKEGRFLLMDAGANTDCKVHNMVQFALMGEVYARYLYHKERPKVGLLSVGGEDIKGCELTKEAFKRLEQLPINFVGNVEANTAFEGACDVLVSDGFSGNVMLKCAEGLARSTGYWLKQVLTKSAARVVGAALAKNAFAELKAYGSSDVIGGAPLLGINGICIIGHGGSNPVAVRNAIRVSAECVEFGLNQRIVAAIEEAGDLAKENVN